MTSELNYIAALQRMEDLARAAERARLARLPGNHRAARSQRMPLRLRGRGLRRRIATADAP
jgi:hypothetical protein